MRGSESWAKSSRAAGSQGPGTRGKLAEGPRYLVETLTVEESWPAAANGR
jgi:hypothetical protein